MAQTLQGSLILYFLVDILLLFGINYLLGEPPLTGRILLSALYDSICAACSLLPGLSFLRGAFLHILVSALVGLTAFGFSSSGVRKSLIFLLLHIALQNKGEGILLIACGVIIICLFFLRKEAGELYVPVELCHNGRKLSLTALRDTGNCLRDPVTGKPVLIVDATIAEGLTGLSHLQLRSPMETMGTLPGLRLIPYKTVGGTGLLLALRLQNVKIGSWQGSSLVAFSPEIFSMEGMYQALTGGIA